MLAEVARTGPAITVQAFWADRDEAWALGRALLGEVAAADFAAVDALPDQLRTALATLLPDLLRTTWPWTRRASGPHSGGGVRLATALDRPLLWWTTSSGPTRPACGSSLPCMAAFPGCASCWRTEWMRYQPRLGRGIPPTDGGGPSVELGPLTASAIARLTPTPELATALGQHTDRTPLA